MKNYSFAICENEVIQAEWLQSLVEEYAASQHVSIQINIWESAEIFLFHYAENKDVDIILLDIQMNAMTGMEMARQLREQDDSVALLFITGLTDYISEGYSVEAIDYLVKPLKKEKLFQALDRLLAKYPVKEEFLLVEQDDEQIKISRDDILFIEVEGREIKVVMKKQVIFLKNSLQSFSKQLNQEQFVQPYRNVVVNCSRIKRIRKGSLIMDDDSVIPVSRRNQQKVVAAFTKYFREE